MADSVPILCKLSLLITPDHSQPLFPNIRALVSSSPLLAHCMAPVQPVQQLFAVTD